MGTGFIACLAAAALGLAQAAQGGADGSQQEAQVLKIQWQRLVDEQGATCTRCGATEAEVERAAADLARALGALGIGVVLEKAPLDAAAFAEDMSRSNRIWINGVPLEQWLGAAVGMSDCESCCEVVSDDVECRTLILGDQTYEAVPAVLIVKAGLLAAAQLLDAPPAESCCPSGDTATPCCPPGEESEPCCPPSEEGEDGDDGGDK